MKIEFIEVPGDDYFTHILSINGNPYVKSRIHKKSLYPCDEAMDLLENITLIELSEYFTDVFYSIKTDWSSWEFAMKIVLSKDTPGYLHDFDPEPVFLLTACNIDYINWNRHYSIHQLQEAFEKVLTSHPEADYYYDPIGEGVFGFTIEPDYPDMTLADFSGTALEIAEPIQKEALKLVSSMAAPDFVATIFEFPEEFKTACKQYLVYFAQFLADMGINANTIIKDNANKVLFTVIPEDANVALDNIKRALQVYMEAPASTSLEKVIKETGNKDAAVRQWEANIYHLRAQLAMAEAVLQAKDATIEALNISNYLLKQTISANQQPQIVHDVSNDEEPVLGNIVSVRSYQGPGFKINLPEILRLLKRMFPFR